MRIFFGLIRFPFMEGDRRSNFPEGGRFLPLKVGEVGSYCGKMDLFPLYVTAFQIGMPFESTSLFRRRRRSQFMNEFSLVR